MKKILDGYFEASDRYEKAFAVGDHEAVRKYSAELVSYSEKYQKELKFSDEQIEKMKELWLRMENGFIREAETKAELEESRRAARKAEQEYYKALLGQTPNKKKYTEH